MTSDLLLIGALALLWGFITQYDIHRYLSQDRRLHPPKAGDRARTAQDLTILIGGSAGCLGLLQVFMFWRGLNAQVDLATVLGLIAGLYGMAMGSHDGRREAEAILRAHGELPR